MLKLTKLNYNKNILEESENINKAVWQLVNEELNRSTTRKHSIALNIHGNHITDPKQIVESFGKYFTDINEKSVNDFYGHNISKSCTTQKLRDQNFFFFPIEPDEILSAIRCLKNSGSCSGPDAISARLLKAIASSIAEPLCYLFNHSISSGCFPAQLKTAKVIPVHKKDATDDIANYRPISLLSQLSKVFEKIVHKRMYQFLNKFSILSDHQHGFRTDRSTQTACTEFMDFVYESLDKGDHVAGIFFDLTRAFDCLQHGFIIDKLYHVGFRGIFLNWILSFLSQRSIYVNHNGFSSSKYKSNMGVPQGSVLGPLLFLLFINDLPDFLVACIIILFADDASLAIRADSRQELEKLCEELVKRFTDWCKSNALIINLNKTQVIKFHHRNSGLMPPFVINGSAGCLASVECVKFLGLCVDKNLRWHCQIENLCKKLNRSYYAIHRVKNSLPLDALINVYYGLVYCHLCYNVVLWGSSSESERVFIIQKKIIRLMFNLKPRESCREIFKNYKLLTFPCIYLFSCVMFVRCNLAGLTMCSDFHNYPTRHQNIICVPIHKTAKYESSPRLAGITFYNHLPTRIKLLNDKLFKKEVKTFFIQNCFYSTREFLQCSLS